MAFSSTAVAGLLGWQQSGESKNFTPAPGWAFGFVDLQVNGYRGVSFSNPNATMEALPCCLRPRVHC